jgi:hypothetical protein
MKALATNQTIQWFYQRHKEETLILSPDFQRNPIWQQPQKEYLLETILLDLPVPEVYVVNQITPTGESSYVVVDGQQRLRTIIEFITEEFIFRHESKYLQKVKKFSDLSIDKKQQFWRYPIVVRDLEESSDEEVRDLFQRLNKYSFVLNDQELRNARFKGQFLTLVEKIGEFSFWPASGLFSANDIRRMTDLEYISILLSTMIGGIFHRKDRVDEFYVMYENEFDESKYYLDRFHEILELIDLSLPNIRKSRWSNKADFFTLFTCLDQIKFAETDQQILVPNLTEELTKFARQVIQAKNDPDNASPNIKEYADAATYGTNDKDRRVKRHKILTEFLKNILA